MEYICAACQQKVTGDMIMYLDHTDQHIIDLLKNDHPEWVEKEGICKQCVEYYQQELKGSIFKDAPCVLRQRKVKGLMSSIKNIFSGRKGSA